MPPTQCVRQRQSMEAWLSASTSPRMVAPVVVKPETVSKSASMKNGISRLRTNGSAADNREDEPAQRDRNIALTGVEAGVLRLSVGTGAPRRRD